MIRARKTATGALPTDQRACSNPSLDASRAARHAASPSALRTCFAAPAAAPKRRARTRWAAPI